MTRLGGVIVNGGEASQKLLAAEEGSVFSHLDASLTPDAKPQTMKEISKKHLFVGYCRASGN